MSPRVWCDRLHDVLDAVEEIFAFTDGMHEATFAADAKTRKAVLAYFAIIGEAAAHVPDEVAGEHPEIPWRSLWKVRNFVIHAYFRVEPAIV